LCGYRAVFFDCDGVLVDSERLISALLVSMTNELSGGLTLADGDLLFHGVHLAGCIDRIAQHLRRPVPADFGPAYQRRSATMLRDQIVAVDGAAHMACSLSVPSCVVSNSPRERVELMLRATGLLGYFSGRVYSAAEAGRWKPAPDVYLHAASRMGVRPAQCVAIEDSAVGVKSAVSAGLSVIGLASAERAGALLAAGAATTCPTMEQIENLLR
jgi:HAD superfamily hydrolase (TIGR01509 family)